MIDLHSHILPGVDDGADDWEEALRMMRMAARAGTTDLVATPHSYRLWRGASPAGQMIRTLVAEAQHRAEEAGLALRVLPGQECQVHPDLASDLRRGEWLTLGDSTTLLLEFPFASWPSNAAAFLSELRSEGYTVLLAHPERYRALHERPNLLYDLVEMGVYTQVTSTSIMGYFGERTQVLARQFLEGGLAHVIASDSHSSGQRNPALSDAVERAGEWIGKEAARRLVLDTPRALLRNAPLQVPPPEPVQERRRASWFGTIFSE